MGKKFFAKVEDLSQIIRCKILKKTKEKKQPADEVYPIAGCTYTASIVKCKNESGITVAILEF